MLKLIRMLKLQPRLRKRLKRPRTALNHQNQTKRLHLRMRKLPQQLNLQRKKLKQLKKRK